VSDILEMIVPTITFGNIIEICTIAVGGIWVLIKMNNSVNVLKTDVSGMQREIVKISDVLTKLAVADTRLTNIERDIRELKHGDGFVRNRASSYRPGIDGEYP
jgi:hypothetical protein